MSEERLHIFFAGTGFPESGGAMSEERVPTLAQVVADLQDTVLAHEEELKSAAEMVTSLTRRVAQMDEKLNYAGEMFMSLSRGLSRMGKEVEAQEDRLRVIVERLESLERDRYAAEQLTTLHLRVAALEAKLTVHLEAIGQMAQEVERLDTLRNSSALTNTKKE